MHIIELVMGDWSQDGHNHTETMVVESSHTLKDLQKAYKQGVKKSKFDISKFCQEYDDNTVSNELYIYFLGQDVEMTHKYDSDAEYQSIEYDDFAHIYLKTCELGDNTFKYVKVKPQGSVINIGGYGLFSS